MNNMSNNTMSIVQELWTQEQRICYNHLKLH